MPAKGELRGSRRDLALVFSEGWKTANEAGREMGRPTGSIFGVLRRMHADGLLEADSEEPTRGTQYRLTDHGRNLLREAPDSEGVVGRLAVGQRMLLVERRKSLGASSEVLAGTASAALIAWGAELPNGWLLALVPGVDPHQVRKLQRAFEGAGCRCVEAPIDAVVPGRLLRERAAQWAGVES